MPRAYFYSAELMCQYVIEGGKKHQNRLSGKRSKPKVLYSEKYVIEGIRYSGGGLYFLSLSLSLSLVYFPGHPIRGRVRKATPVLACYINDYRS